jgi:hypothetical protein
MYTRTKGALTVDLLVFFQRVSDLSGGRLFSLWLLVLMLITHLLLHSNNNNHSSSSKGAHLTSSHNNKKEEEVANNMTPVFSSSPLPPLILAR